MKRVWLICLLFIGFQRVSAQSDTLAVYKRFPNLPVFNLIKLPDSTKFTRDDLNRRKATMIMLFSPDCDHCIHATKDLLQQIDLFKQVQVIMVSSIDYTLTQTFFKDYSIADHPNIIMARDASFYLGTFYNLKQYPSVYLYNKKGKFIREFIGSFTMKEVAGYF